MLEWIADNSGLIGLLFFFSFFTGTALWMCRPGAKAYYQKQADIPLNDDVKESDNERA